MFGIGMTELVVILVIALLIFGPNKLPELARSLGKGFGEFRRASYDLRQSLMEATEPDPPPDTQAAKPGPAAAATPPGPATDTQAAKPDPATSRSAPEAAAERDDPGSQGSA